ncbi:MAG: hypothetical protein RIS70_2029, partial [Planctomycetota bacterium]
MKLPKLLLGTVLFFATCCEGCVGSRWLLPHLSMDPETLAQEEDRSSEPAGERSDRSDVADGDRDRQSSDHFANDRRDGDTNDALANRPLGSSPADPPSNLAKDDSESTAPNSSVSKQLLRDSANRERSKSAEERLDSQSTEVSSGSNVRLSLNADSANSSAR